MSNGIVRMGSKFWYLVLIIWSGWSIYEYVKESKTIQNGKSVIHGDTTMVMISCGCLILYFIFSWINKTEKLNNTNTNKDKK